jgi:hypothetical protein
VIVQSPARFGEALDGIIAQARALRHFVKDEADKQRMDLECHWSLALALCFAIEGLRINDVSQSGWILLSWRASVSCFRGGKLPDRIRNLLVQSGS